MAGKVPAIIPYTIVLWSTAPHDKQALFELNSRCVGIQAVHNNAVCRRITFSAALYELVAELAIGNISFLPWLHGSPVRCNRS